MGNDGYRERVLFRRLSARVCSTSETGQLQFSGQKIKKTGLKVRFQKTHRLLRAHTCRWRKSRAVIRRQLGFSEAAAGYALWICLTEGRHSGALPPLAYICSGAVAGHEPPVGSPLQFPGFFAAFSRKRSLNLHRQAFSPDWLQCSVMWSST